MLNQRLRGELYRRVRGCGSRRRETRGATLFESTPAGGLGARCDGLFARIWVPLEGQFEQARFSPRNAFQWKQNLSVSASRCRPAQICLPVEAESARGFLGSACSASCADLPSSGRRFCANGAQAAPPLRIAFQWNAKVSASPPPCVLAEKRVPVEAKSERGSLGEERVVLLLPGTSRRGCCTRCAILRRL